MNTSVTNRQIDVLNRIEQNPGAIFVREQVNGTWGNHPLVELPANLAIAHVCRLIRNSMQVPDEALDQPPESELSIDDLELNIRTRGCLHDAHIETVAELTSHWSPLRLLRLRNLGEKSLREIMEALATHGRALPNPTEEEQRHSGHLYHMWKILKRICPESANGNQP